MLFCILVSKKTGFQDEDDLTTAVENHVNTVLLPQLQAKYTAKVHAADDGTVLTAAVKTAMTQANTGVIANLSLEETWSCLSDVKDEDHAGALTLQESVLMVCAV